MSDAILPEDKLHVAERRSVQEWMDLFLAILEDKLKEGEAEGQDVSKLIYTKYQSETVPRCKRIAQRFQDAGLVLSEDIDFVGPVPNTDGTWTWPNPSQPYIQFIWPDNSTLSFIGEEALTAFNFFAFWQQYQAFCKPNDEQSRIIKPGSPEYNNYMINKQRDQQKGVEP